ncbi:MAG: hypothetical protein KM310_04770 [Clostridiales bacterium]|nr:hypothetical protein [Clostridiales bacterium]
MSPRREIHWAEASLKTPHGLRWYSYRLLPLLHDLWLLEGREKGKDDVSLVTLREGPALWSFWSRVIRDGDPVLPVHLREVAEDWPCLEMVVPEGRRRSSPRVRVAE